MDTSDTIRADEAEPGMRWWSADGSHCTIRNARIRQGSVVLTYHHACSDELHVVDLPRTIRSVPHPPT